MERITSRDNKTVKLAAYLGKSRQARREHGLFLAEGARLCGEAAACGTDIVCLLMTEQWALRFPRQASLLKEHAEKAMLLEEKLARCISDQASPQGVFSLCRAPEDAAEESFFAPGRYLALDALQDPGNLGTVIRTADAFALSGLILGPGCADRYSPKVLRATMGSVFRLRVLETADLAALLGRMQAAGAEIFGAALDRAARRLSGTVFPENCVVVVGNEGNGISAEVLSRCGRKIFIDMPGKAESLNAGVAASILMWEMGRGAGGR